MKYTEYEQGSIFRLILQQAVQLTLPGLTQIQYSIIDRIYLGHISGESIYPLICLGINSPIVSMISALPQLLGQGNSSLFSIVHDEKNTSKSEGILGNFFKKLLSSSLILTLIGSPSYMLSEPTTFLMSIPTTIFIYTWPKLTIECSEIEFSTKQAFQLNL